MYARIHTLKEIYTRLATALQQIYPEPEAKSITYWVLEETLGYTKAKMHASWTDMFPATISEQLDFILHQLLQYKPVQYVFGKAYFMGFVFKVNEHVLIPRPETEELVQWITTTCKENALHSPRILDIGTGSGCIAIALAKLITNAHVQGIDVSAEALKVAAKNAHTNEVQVQFEEVDVLSTNFAKQTTQLFDIVVSNPPYIGFSEQAEMRKNVLQFEPHTALFVPDTDVLVFYRAITEYAQKNLKPNGWLFFEINESFGNELVTYLTQQGFIEVSLAQDHFGKDRMIRARKSS